MAFTVLPAADAFWRPSNQMGVLNTDLANQLGATTLGARLWRLTPGQASTRHRHRAQHELYIVLEGTGRVRVDDQLLTLDRLSTLLVEPESVRQVFNDTDADALWLVVGAPPEAASTLEMTPELMAELYPDGPKALPPELSGEDQGPASPALRDRPEGDLGATARAAGSAAPHYTSPGAPTAWNPPSTWTISPLIPSEYPDSSQQIVRATGLGSEVSQPSGAWRRHRSASLSKPGMPWAATVPSGPAETRLTRMPCGPRSRAR